MTNVLLLQARARLLMLVQLQETTGHTGVSPWLWVATNLGAEMVQPVSIDASASHLQLHDIVSRKCAD